MGIFIIIVLAAVCSIIAGKAGKKGWSLLFGIGSILGFIWWLDSGPGHAFVDWLQDPSVDVPSVDINQ